MTDRGLWRAELLDSLEIELAQPPLGGIMLGGSATRSRWAIVAAWTSCWWARVRSVECWRRQARYNATTPPLPTPMLSLIVTV